MANETSKYIQLADTLRQQIRNRHWPVGTQLPTDSELAIQNGVNRRTVARAMRLLVGDGLVARKPRRGTILLRVAREERGNSGVGIFMPTHGHIFGAMNRIITSKLLEHDLYPIGLNMVDYCEGRQCDIKLMRSIMERVLRDRPYGVIIDADSLIPLQPLRPLLQRKDCRVVFVLHFQHARKFANARYVRIDPKEIGSLMARHLIRAGHRRITFFANPEPRESDKYFPSPQTLMLAGMRDECARSGVVFADDVSRELMQGIPVDEVLRRYFQSSRERPTGAGMLQDAYWVSELQLPLLQMGLRVPEDLSLVGCYNTPWCLKTTPRLTSVSIQEEKMARLAAQMLLGEVNDTDVTIRPELIVRDSVRTWC